jgi:hypothetical protein
MAKGNRSNLAHLLHSAWEQQERLSSAVPGNPMVTTHSPGLSVGDQIAIIMGCLGGAVVIVTYLIPKTPFFTGLLLFLLWIFLSYPLLHFVRPLKVKIPTVLIVCVLVFLFGRKVWPENKPTADIMTEDAVSSTPTVGQPPSINFYVRNDTPYNLDIRNFNLINLDAGVPSQEEENRREDDKWEELRKYVAETEVSATNYPAKVRSWSSVIDQRVKLTADQVNAIKNNTGAVTIRFMSVYQYRDSTGEHEWDQCVLVQNTFAVVHCSQHNGPSWPMPHKSWR